MYTFEWEGSGLNIRKRLIVETLPHSHNLMGDPICMVDTLYFKDEEADLRRNADSKRQRESQQDWNDCGMNFH